MRIAPDEAPFNPVSVITYATPEKSRVALHIYDLRGRRIQTLMDGRVDAGVHTVTWDGRNSVGHQVASGRYFYRLRVGGLTQIRQVVLLE